MSNVTNLSCTCGTVKGKLKVIGPVKMKAFGKYAKGKMPQDAHPKIPLSFMLRGLFGKKNTPSPFFRNREPVVKAIDAGDKLKNMRNFINLTNGKLEETSFYILLA
ncbi:hypothetical protein A9Q81_27560 [Gammaproteobacteria bacterium 42_54_T18]|nr:hypothetical protein A9Q81_27560 [Gammaproteobacteria bacterium 42_54_T18]